MRFFFLGERLAVDLLNTVVVVQHGRVQYLPQGPRDVAAWAEAAGVLPHGALRGRAADREAERLRGFRETLRRGVVGWGGGGTQPRRVVAPPHRPLGGDPEGSEGTGRPGQRGTRRRRTHAPPRRPYTGR